MIGVTPTLLLPIGWELRCAQVSRGHGSSLVLREGVSISQVLSCKNRPPLGDSALQRFIERTWGFPGAELAQTIPQVRGDRKTTPPPSSGAVGCLPAAPVLGD